MKKIKILSFVIALLVVFTGCSSANYDMGKNESITESFAPQAPMESPEMGWNDFAADIEEEVSAEDSASSVDIENDVTSGNRKLIRTFNLDVETLDFDSFVVSIKDEVKALGGYVERSNASGNSYNYTSNRNASFVCRIPSAKLDAFVNTVGNLGNVTYSFEDTQDITLTYVDMEARVTSLQTEYDRLLELLAKAETVDAIIMLEQRLSDVRYQLESYKSQLRTYDNLVDYSTVTVNVQEVKRVTSPEKESVWERIESDFADNVYSVWVGLQDFFVWFVGSIPIFAILAVIVIIILLIVKASLNLSPAYREKRKAKKLAKAYKKAQEAKEKEEVKQEENKE